MRAATNGLPLPEILDHVVEASGLRAHYLAEKEGADRLENLAELVNAATMFVAERDVQPVGDGGPGDDADPLTAFLHMLHWKPASIKRKQALTRCN